MRKFNQATLTHRKKDHTQPLSIFEKQDTQDTNINNIKISLSRISDFIANYHIVNNREGDILCRRI